jgi:peptide/nickel transport system ATP-binding protein
MDNNKLLEIKDLTVHYITDEGVVAAINELNLSIGEGENLGLVGETGAGKTTTALSIMNMIPNPPGKIISGEVLFKGENLLNKSKKEIRKIRGREISMIFQDPMTSLNPVLTVGEQIAEVIRLHEKISKADASLKAQDMLKLVGIPPDRFMEYPHQFSGGMRQRVGIAIALACNPTLLIADEPTTALDVTIQAQVLDLMKKLKKELGTSMILITHDLGVVSEICDDVAIMYAGEIVEYGTLEDIYNRTAHPYTKGLFGSIPVLDDESTRLNPIMGLTPDPYNLPIGCSFAPRCAHGDDTCHEKKPEMINIGGKHLVKCGFIKRQMGVYDNE